MITTLALTIVVINLRDVSMKSMFVRTKVLAILLLAHLTTVVNTTLFLAMITTNVLKKFVIMKVPNHGLVYIHL